MTTPSLRRQIQHITWQRAPFFFLFMLVSEPLVVAFSDLPRTGNLSWVGMAPLALHATLFLVALGSLVYWFFWIRRDRWSNVTLVEATTALIGTLALSLTAACTVVDLADGGLATPFLANLLICAAMALIPFGWSFFVYLVPTGVFFLGTLFLGAPTTHMVGDLAYAACFSVVALAISRFQYQNQMGLLTKNAELDFLSSHDPLTGLANRSHFQTKTDWQLSALRRSGGVASLVLADVDRFKTINDKYGHPTGDQVLKAAAQVFQQTVRDVDCVSRWGGEEFLILLADTPLDEAVRVAERLRTAVTLIEVPGPTAPVHFTISFGVASLSGQSPVPFQDAYARADAALYRAKTRGRNRVEVTTES